MTSAGERDPARSLATTGVPGVAERALTFAEVLWAFLVAGRRGPRGKCGG
ncbi:hypothetical protein [Streptomyces sp. DT18]